LLAQPPLNGADVAPKLSQAVTQSGLFYESHQAKWVAGQLTMAQLQQEPQGQHPIALAIRQFAAASPAALPQIAEPNALAQAPTRANLAPETTGKTEIMAKAESALLPKDLALALSAANAKPGNAAIGDSLLSLQTPFPLRTESSPLTASTAAPAHQIPDDLRPLVQQQLDSVATQRLAWHGEVWPGQKMDWQIEWEKEASRDDAETSQEKWNTTLRLTTPRLGQVDASLTLTGNGIRINLATPYGASAADLRNGSPALTSALEAAGLQVVGLQVKHEEE
jgi:flagellar hook-length control protein FliK